MKILMIPSWYQTKTNRILGSFFREQALMLKKMGHDVAVIKVDLHSPKESFEKKVEIYDDDGLVTIRRNVHSFGIAKNSLLYCHVVKNYYNSLFKLLTKNWGIPDVIQAHSYLPAGYVGVHLGRKYKLPVVVTEHLSKVHNKNLNYFDIKVLNYTANNCAAFVCVSESLKRAVEEMTGLNDIKIIPNNLSPKFGFMNKKSEPSFKFVCVGNLIDSKRQMFLVDCFKEAFPTSDEELYIVGQGVNYYKLEKHIKFLEMEQRIHLTGALERDDVAAILNESHVFCLLSYSETFGVSYIEALACGCPVVASENGGSEEIVNDKNGLIVPVDDRAATIKALVDIRKNYHNYDIKKISDDCISLYNENVIAKKTIELYESVIEKHKR